MGSFQRPLAVAERCIFMRVIRTLHNIAAAHHVILTVGRTVHFVGIIATVVLLVAFERCVDTLAVRTVERACAERSCRKIIISLEFNVRVKYLQKYAT